MKWMSHIPDPDVYYVEFQTNDGSIIAPTAYYLTTANDAKAWPGLNPKSWKVMAKRSQRDSWTTIATVTNDNKLPAEGAKRVRFDLDVKYQYWQYFRFEVSEVQNGNRVQLAEFEFDEKYSE